MTSSGVLEKNVYTNSSVILSCKQDLFFTSSDYYSEGAYTVKNSHLEFKISFLFKKNFHFPLATFTKLILLLIS